MRTTNHLEFNTESGGTYLFDSATGAVVAANPIMRRAIDLYATRSMAEVSDELKQEHPAREVDGIVSFIQRWERNWGGFYRSEKSEAKVREQMDTVQEADITKYLADGNIFQIVINLTEDCNLRCRYCFLSEVYDYTRNRTSAKLELQTGIKALDLFFDMLKPIAHKIPGKQAAVTFYGGEPLLMFDILRKLVEYATKHSPVPLIFNMTSNGYALTDDMMDFIVAHEVNIAISLDGNKENHDRNRVLANGEGTFDVVYRNIKRFQKRYPDYSRRTLVCVYDIKTDLEGNVRFFEEQALPRIIFLNGVSETNTEYYTKFSEDEIAKFNQTRRKLLRQYLDLRREGTLVSGYLQALCADLANVIIRPKVGDVRSFITPYTGTCVPGIKFSVRVDGSLDMCERINQTFSIGHVDTGLDYAAIIRIIQKYNSAVTRHCSSCALSKNCSLCFAQCNRECRFTLPEAWCENFHTSFMTYCRQVYSVLEDNPSAFNYLNNVVTEDILYYA